MKAVYSVYEAKARLSELLRAVKRKHEVTITERGRPVARVLPFDDRADLDTRMAELERSGQVIAQSAPWPEGYRPLVRRGALGRFLRQRRRP